MTNEQTGPSEAAPDMPAPSSGWFAGPKAENGDWFAATIGRIVSDYHAWRRNYFPEDGVVVDSAARREAEPFRDRFDDRLMELLARLKRDVPFHSPRYAGHMIAEQSLPAIAGYLAAMLYNPNNVSSDAAPVTVRLELEAATMIAEMLGHPADGWAHLTGGGTIANLEALWVARTVKYLPLAVAEARQSLGLGPEPDGADVDTPAGKRRLLGIRPHDAMEQYARLYRDAAALGASGGAGMVGAGGSVARVERALLGSRFHPAQRGMASIGALLRSAPVVLAPETHHYCFEKAMDVLGLGRDALVPVRVDSEFRMRVDDLGAKLDEADRTGRHVLAVVTVVGSTEEGAIDPVNQILDLRSERERSGRGSFWLHADGAYGGYLRTMMVPGRSGLGPNVTKVKVGTTVHELAIELPQRDACDALERLGECDSITIDPHKLGYIPYPAGCICFRSSLVKPLARQHAPYLAEGAADPDSERRAEAIGIYILEGSKPGAAAAAVWLSHTLIPLDNTGHGVLVRETIRNACEFGALLEAYPRLVRESGQEAPPVRAVCLCPPGSNIVCYAFAPTEGAVDLAGLNNANQRVYLGLSVQDGHRATDRPFFVSRTTLACSQYSPETVNSFLRRLGVPEGQYEEHGVFLLRSVLMNPWYKQAKQRGRYFVSELVAELYAAAAREFATMR